MPIYEYACKNCEHTLDVLQKVIDEPLVDCPACGRRELRRLLSAPRFRLKGQGWYETDFKKDKQRNVLKTDSEPASADKKSDKGSDTAKPEKKPASKSEAKSES